jgi:biopolymer transport protein ExbD
MSEGGGSIFGEGKKSFFGEGGGGGASDGPGVVDLNLTPLMDVMSNILFFLLASFGAAIISFLACSVPVQSDDPNTNPTEPRTDQVTCNLQINPDGFKVNLSNDKIAREKLDELKISIPKKDGTYDKQALNEHLYKVKTAYPGSDTVMIVPNDRTRYEDIVGAMEASKDIKIEGKRLRLFPKAVVADLVKAE